MDVRTADCWDAGDRAIKLGATTIFRDGMKLCCRLGAKYRYIDRALDRATSLPMTIIMNETAE